MFDLRPNYGGGNEGNVDLLQKVPFRHCYTQCPQPCSRPSPTHGSAGDSWALTGTSGSVSSGVTAPFFWVLVHTSFCLCFPIVCFTIHVRSGGSMVGLMVTFSKRAYAIPKSFNFCLCRNLLFTHISAGDTQTQLWLSLCGVSGSWCVQGLFEPSEHLWCVWGLILNVILSLLPYFWVWVFSCVLPNEVCS